MSNISLNWNLSLPNSSKVVFHESNTGFRGDGERFTIIKMKEEETELTVFNVDRAIKVISFEDKELVKEITKSTTNQDFNFVDKIFVRTLIKDEVDRLIILYDTNSKLYYLFEKLI